jgi:hypothetical protein
VSRRCACSGDCLSTLLSSLTPLSSSSSDALPCSSGVVERIVDLLLYLPPSEAPPDLNSIEEAFFKDRGLLRKAGARSHEALVEAMGSTLSAVTAYKVRGFFEHRSYRHWSNRYDKRSSSNSRSHSG